MTNRRAKPEILVCSSCGEKFEHWNYTKTKTCSRRCRKIMVRREKGGFTPKQQEIITGKRLTHDKCRRGVKNIAGRSFSLVSRDGKTFFGTNLREFVRTHAELFDEPIKTDNDVNRWAQILSKLRPSHKKQYTQTHGWTWSD